MNKAITEGLVLMPPPFVDGLDVWSSENGTLGSATYDNSANAAFVPTDQDFAGCLELLKTQTTQKLRWMGQTPLLPGCYLRIRTKVKALAGALPSVRIAGYPMLANDTHASGYVEVGPTKVIENYGEIVEIEAIVGTGERGGVDMVWGPDVDYAHFGLDLTGSNGGVVRVEDFIIEDITAAFLRDMMDWVDVRDFGAKGDGVTDDKAAFEAADDAANGRSVLVGAGTYKIGSNLTIDNAIRFEGTVTMADNVRLSLIRNFDLPTYIDAFGDEVLAFKKAFQALLNYTDHDALDMGGRRIELDRPIDMQGAVDNHSSFLIRRVIRNGQFYAIDSPHWDPDVVSSTGSYNAANPYQMTNVANIANIQPGSLVTGNGVGREVYVQYVNVGAGSLTLSQPLYGPAASQSYTFTRFKYMLDFSGFTQINRMTISNVEFQNNGSSSTLLLSPTGENFIVQDCFVIKPSHRGITSPGRGCQDLHIDRTQFISDEQSTPATDRISVAFNVNANDAKIRDNRFQRMGLTGVMHGESHLIVGNHWFQGDEVTDGPRVAGMVFTYENVSTVMIGNYIDNCFIEWTNEHDENPDYASEFSFGGLTITGNVFRAMDVASWSNFLVIKPYGAGHSISDLHVNNNTFKSIQGNIDRIEAVDDSIAPLDYWRTRNVTFEGNTFAGVTQRTVSPVTLEFEQNTDATTWTMDPSAYLPFGGNARTVTSVVAKGDILNGVGDKVHQQPSTVPNAGTQFKYVQLKWPEAVRGKVLVTLRVDNPI
ncbi:glycosyl hydrolase family 28-related protein [Aliiroseovarius subalbicans]|uniref:glycosyl hydrolase family 28-related protein n=1 Tax=Aliiroseovarius subalbicans TaxID=2925840 RepID=UPI001F576AAF|nr:glycosyl hydrolase family 28-related protein [Aliiroseovarius subalbicans]MCI2397861.1 right-handed parallel beta-helix repeat-containing protein [Aliiroseovarius subalbicans]